jgi:serine/threonine-protein kinase
MTRGSAVRGAFLLLAALAAPSAHAALPQLRSDSPFRLDVSNAPLHPDSAAIIAWLEDAGGWGTGSFRIDFSIDVVDADASAPTVELVKNPGYYHGDCDDSGSVPLPPGGTVEGYPDYQCLSGGDCHLIVHDVPRSLLFEAYVADVTNGVFTATCLVEWKLLAIYPPNLRGEGCTSADAAGFPIAPLLFDADEIAAGEIAHAIRFILPNSRIRAGSYVHPATHFGAPTAPSGSDAPVYGMRLRLRSDFPMDGYSASAQVILQALQRYGMFLSDGGNIALTARSDRGTTAKWEDLGIDSHALAGVAPGDFEVLPGYGPDPYKGPYPTWPDCVRNTIPEPDGGMLAAIELGALLVVRRARRGATS